MPRAPSSAPKRKGPGPKGPIERPLPLDPSAAPVAPRFSRGGGAKAGAGRRSGAARAEAQVGEHLDEEERQEAGLRITGSTAGAAKGKKDGFVDAALSRNILRLAREQAEEMEMEAAEAAVVEQGAASSSRAAGAMRHVSHEEHMASDDDDDDDDDDARFSDTGSLRSDEFGDASVEEYEEISPEDAAMLARFDEENGFASGPTSAQGGTLAELIMAKIADSEQESKKGIRFGQGAVDGQQRGEVLPPGVNEKVAEVYTKVGDLLSRYKSGPLPKAFKIIPSLPNWDVIVYLTNPSTWTPHATLAATRIFASNLKPAQSQKFYRFVLLPKFRDEVDETGKCSTQIFESLVKSVYKPAAFFKGVLFPLTEGGCTLKEAAILSSVISRVSIPVLHSAAALLRLAEQHYRGPTSLFLRVLLDKKYALPYKVVDALVFHFLRFADPDMGVEKMEDGTKRMPVLWHQSFLVFCQRYKQDLTPDQKAALIDLLRVQKHDSIGAEIRRELTTGKARGEMLEEPMEEDEAMSV